MSRDNPTVYGVLVSDRRIQDQHINADRDVAARLVVEHGIYAQMEVSTNNYLWLTIYHQDQPGVPLRKFRYSLEGNVWDEV